MFAKKIQKNELSQYTISEQDDEQLSDSIEVLPIGTTTLTKRSHFVWAIFLCSLFVLALLLSLYILFEGFTHSL